MTPTPISSAMDGNGLILEETVDKICHGTAVRIGMLSLAIAHKEAEA
jgi:hypothetical protein